MKVKTIGKVIIDGQKFSDVNIDGTNIAGELSMGIIWLAQP